MAGMMTVEVTDWSTLKKETLEKQHKGTFGFLLTERSYLRYKNRKGKVMEIPLSPTNVSSFHFDVHLSCMLLTPKLRNLYISRLILGSTSASGLDPKLRYKLANMIADFAIDFTKPDQAADDEESWLGFFVVADVELARDVICDDYEDEEKEEEEEVDSCVTSDDDDSELETCVICMEEIWNMEEVRTMPCSHRFHQSCICRWFMVKWNCPTCRREFDVCFGDEAHDDTLIN